jgi:hypothetical protein
MPEPEETTPFGLYLSNLLGRRSGRPPEILQTLYDLQQELQVASSIDSASGIVLRISSQMDGEMPRVRRALGGGVTPFSTLRGYFLEEVALTIAKITVRRLNPQITVRKFSTGKGVVTGLSLRYSRGNLPTPTEMTFRKDREDVILGFPRDLRITDGSATGSLTLTGQIVPFCVIACKIYIDATRLENVLAKARSILPSYAGASFFVLAEWDALGSEWHGAGGEILDALYAPVERLIFLRAGERPDNSELQSASRASPYRRDRLSALSDRIKRAYENWAAT